MVEMFVRDSTPNSFAFSVFVNLICDLRILLCVLDTFPCRISLNKAFATTSSRTSITLSEPLHHVVGVSGVRAVGAGGGEAAHGQRADGAARRGAAARGAAHAHAQRPARAALRAQLAAPEAQAGRALVLATHQLHHLCFFVYQLPSMQHIGICSLETMIQMNSGFIQDA